MSDMHNFNLPLTTMVKIETICYLLYGMYLICLIIAGSLKINPDCTRLSVFLFIFIPISWLLMTDIFSDTFDSLLHNDMCLILHNECIESSHSYNYNDLMI